MSGSPTRGMGPRMIGKEAFEQNNSGNEVAKVMGFGRRMLTDSPDELKEDGSRGPVGQPSESERRTEELLRTRGSEKERENLMAAEAGTLTTVGQETPAQKGYSIGEVKRLMDEAPARAQELFEAEQARPDGVRMGALKAIHRAAVADGNTALADSATQEIDRLKAADTEE